MTTPRGDAERRTQSLYSTGVFRLWLLLTIGVSSVFAFQSFYPAAIGPLSNIFPSVCAGILFISALLCLRRYGFRLRQRFQVIWFCFALGGGLWFLAELAWATYYFVLGIAVPYPSLADVFYLGGYAPMMFGLVLYLKVFSRGMSKRRLGIALASVGASVAIVLVVVLPIEFVTSQPLLITVTNLIYPILDLLLETITILCLAIFFGGAIAKWWYLFGGAVGLYIVGDEYFLYQIATGSYYNGSFDDLLFILGYLVFVLAFYEHRRQF
jgi:hypothetical protein